MASETSFHISLCDNRGKATQACCLLACSYWLNQPVSSHINHLSRKDPQACLQANLREALRRFRYFCTCDPTLGQVYKTLTTHMLSKALCLNRAPLPDFLLLTAQREPKSDHQLGHCYPFSFLLFPFSLEEFLNFNTNFYWSSHPALSFLRLSSTENPHPPIPQVSSSTLPRRDLCIPLQCLSCPGFGLLSFCLDCLKIPRVHSPYWGVWFPHLFFWCVTPPGAMKSPPKLPLPW